MYAGIDLGTLFTKTHDGLIIPSGFSEKIYKTSSYVMTVEDNQYTMEMHVNYDINNNKTLNKNFRLNFLYALYRTTSEECMIYKNVVVGLPALQWKNDNVVKDLKRMLNIEEPIEIDVNGKKKIIQVNNIDVVPEGSPAYYAVDTKKNNGRKTLILDWGSKHLNQALYENDEIQDVYSDDFGSLSLFKDMAGEINSKYGTDIKPDDMFDTLENGLSLDGQIIDIKPTIKDIALDCCNEIYKNLQIKWKINIVPYVSMIGGTSIVMMDFIKQFIPQAILEQEAQTISAKGMYLLARG